MGVLEKGDHQRQRGRNLKNNLAEKRDRKRGGKALRNITAERVGKDSGTGRLVKGGSESVHKRRGSDHEVGQWDLGDRANKLERLIARRDQSLGNNGFLLGGKVNYGTVQDKQQISGK